jgi:hypothetical protein
VGVKLFESNKDDRIASTIMSDSETPGPRRQAYSLLKVAEAIEGERFKSNASTKNEDEHSFQGTTNLMKQIHREQRSILSLVKSSLSDIAASISRDSSEIPFDERSAAASSYSDSRKLSPPIAKEGHDDDDQ